MESGDIIEHMVGIADDHQDMQSVKVFSDLSLQARQQKSACNP